MKYHGYIYETTNIINGKKYIGQSTIWHRKETYLGSGILFMSALKKYGKNNFKKQYLAYCKTQKELDKTEQLFIKIYKPEYNLALGGLGKGSVSNETKLKISKAQKGKTLSDETKEKLSKSHKGKIFSDKHKENLSKSLKGKKRTQETKEKLSKAGKGKIISKEQRDKLSKAGKGRIDSKETKEKKRIAAILYWERKKIKENKYKKVI